MKTGVPLFSGVIISTFKKIMLHINRAKKKKSIKHDLNICNQNGCTC